MSSTVACVEKSKSLNPSGPDRLPGLRAEVPPAEAVPPHLHLREVLDLPDVAAAAADDGEVTYLVVSLTTATGRSWMCAPASPRAIDCVRTRRASAWTVMHHSATGTVQIWRTGADGALVESVVLCAHLSLGDLAA